MRSLPPRLASGLPYALVAAAACSLGVPACSPEATPPTTDAGDAGGPSLDGSTPTTDAGVDATTGDASLDAGGSTACPSTSPLTRVASGLLPIGGIGMGASRITSIVVAGSDVYYSHNSEIRKVSTQGAGEATFHSSPGTLGHLATDGTRLFYSDESQGQGGSVMGVPLAGGAATAVFPDVMLQGFEIEQYFDGGNHYVLADVNGPSGKVRKLFRRTPTGTVEPLFARTTSFGFTASFTLANGSFFISERATEAATDKAVLYLPVGSPAIGATELTAQAITHSPTSCDVLVAFGSGAGLPLFCVSSFGGSTTRVISRIDSRPPASAPITLFDPTSHPAAKGGQISTKVATDGDNLYFATNGTAPEFHHAIYKVSRTGVVRVLACDLPEISDMTTGGGDLYVAIDAPSEQTKHGLFKMPR